MSRFFAALQQEQEEEPQEAPEPKASDLFDDKPVEESKKKKKKKKKKKGKDAEQAGPAQPQKPETDKKAEDDGKKKGKKGKKKKMSKAAMLAKKRLEEKRKAQEAARLAEEERIRKEQEEEERKEREAREEAERLEAEKQRKIEERKAKGILTRKERKKKEEIERRRLMLERQQVMFEKKMKEQEELARQQAEQEAQESSESEEEEEEEEEEEQEEDEEDKMEEIEEKPEEGAGELGGMEFGEMNWEDMINEDDVKEVQEALQSKKKANQSRKKKKNAEKFEAKKGKKRRKKKKKEVVEEVIEEAEDDMYADPKKAFYVESRFRCPIICILGHVDTGKTKLLDKIRKTNVQDGEEGGITQQIGASFFPQYKLKEEIAKVTGVWKEIDVEAPGLLIIDTPGHESFANLRMRGESLCDFAILVVDIKHGLENQTLESIELLMERGTPFVVALNKIDTVAEWKVHKDDSSMKSFKNQSSYTRNLFEDMCKPLITSFGKIGINACVYWNKDDDDFISMVPTSAMTGEGIPDLLGFIVDYCQETLTKQITPNLDRFNCTVMEVKKIEGMGTTIDVILVNGEIKEGDKIVLSGFEGPITTTVRAILTPKPLKELRVRADYLHHRSLRGSMGVKIAAPGLEKAMAGSQLYRYETQQDLDDLEEALMEDIRKVRKKIKFKKEGVCVAASTLGSLEALLVFLKSKKIPVSCVCIGDITKEDVMKAMTPLLTEENRIKKKEYATILAFDVKPVPLAAEYAKKNNVKVIIKKIIYHLCDDYMKWVDVCNEEKKRLFRKEAVFPCVLKPVAFFNKKDPIIMGCEVVKGVLKIGTPICVPSKEFLKLGKIISIEANHKQLEEARISNGQIAIKIKSQKKIMAGRHFVESDALFSQLTRNSVDILKDYFRDEMRKSDWDLVREMKTIFEF